MWFTKDSTGFQGWFTVSTSNGSLRTGLLAGDFTVTVVNPADTASNIPIVSESSTKPGLYTFNVPSAFLLANGTGDYGVVIEIDTFTGPSGSPNVRTVFGSVLDVAEKDFNDIAGVTTITDIQNSLNNVENIVTNIESDVTTIFSTLISEQFTIDAGTAGVTSLSESALSTGNTSYPDDFFNGQLVVLVSSFGSAPVILARTISDYSSDGTITVDPAFPFVPNEGDQLIVLARTALGGVVNNNAIANAVWTIATSPTTPGSYGELVNIIGNNTSLIPGLI